jgi:hypothetical protein
MTFPAFSGWKPCFSADHKQFLADYWLVLSCYFKPWSVEQFNWFKMQWTRLKPMKLDRYLVSAFVYKARMFGEGGGGRLWEGGDLERLSLVEDEEPNPRKFFSCQCCVQEWGYCYWRREWSFCKPRYLTLTRCSRKFINNVFYSIYVRNNFLVNLHHDQAKSFNLSNLQP